MGQSLNFEISQRFSKNFLFFGKVHDFLNSPLGTQTNPLCCVELCAVCCAGHFCSSPGVLCLVTCARCVRVRFNFSQKTKKNIPIKTSHNDASPQQHQQKFEKQKQKQKQEPGKRKRKSERRWRRRIKSFDHWC